MDKTQVIGSLLTTVETSLDMITLVLEGNISKREMGKYRQKIERLGGSITRLVVIVGSNPDHVTLMGQVGDIQNKYQLLTSMV